MKKVIYFIAIVSAILLVSCNNSEPSSATEAAPAQTESNETNVVVNGLDNATPPQNATATPPSANGEKHYICPNGCEGSGGDASGNCPNCGATYVHNAAFHAQQQTNTITPDPNAANSIMVNPQQTAEPAQNANGVWHYTCPNGCAGGGGSAGPCSSCGATLAHNASYHQ